MVKKTKKSVSQWDSGMPMVPLKPCESGVFFQRFSLSGTYRKQLFSAILLLTVYINILKPFVVFIFLFLMFLFVILLDIHAVLAVGFTSTYTICAYTLCTMCMI